MTDCYVARAPDFVGDFIIKLAAGGLVSSPDYRWQQSQHIQSHHVVSVHISVCGDEPKSTRSDTQLSIDRIGYLFQLTNTASSFDGTVVFFDLRCVFTTSHMRIFHIIVMLTF